MNLVSAWMDIPSWSSMFCCRGRMRRYILIEQVYNVIFLFKQNGSNGSIQCFVNFSKVRLSTSKKNCVNMFHWKPSKMYKKVFYIFHLKSSSHSQDILLILYHDFLVMKKRWLDYKNVTTWLTNNCNTPPMCTSSKWFKLLFCL